MGIDPTGNAASSHGVIHHAKCAVYMKVPTSFKCMSLIIGNKFTVTTRGFLVEVPRDGFAARFNAEPVPVSCGDTGGAIGLDGPGDVPPTPVATPEVIGEP